NVLRLALGTPSNSTLSHFVEFYAGANGDNDGTKVGGIKLNNGNVVYETSGADFAEYFQSTGIIEAGNIVTMSTNGVQKAERGKQIVGVVSDKAGFVGNKTDEINKKPHVLVGLLGQIDVYVSTEHGEIGFGDNITVGSVSGWG